MKQPLDSCGCCKGIEELTPLPTANRPGLDALQYRVGTHSTFLETMLARLSDHYLEIPADGSDPQGNPKTDRISPLRGFKTRSPEDPAIALLDGWATVADVLSFYQERIANEGYLRTATERRSVLELAGLVGYKPRPGVASSVYLAYALDDNFKGEALIPQGSRSQSIPSGSGELPQSFETSEDLKARASWNNLSPRKSKPQKITLDNALQINKIYLEGVATSLKPNDPLLLVFGDQPGNQVLRLVQESNPDFQNKLTEVSLQETPFLINAAVRLLRIVVAELDRETRAGSPVVKKSENSAKKSGPLDALSSLLESFSLGNYPLLNEAYFSHERIYSYLKGLDTNRKKTNLFTTFSKILGITPIEEENEIINSTLNYLIHILEDPHFKHDLLCLFKYLLKQSQPVSSDEMEALRGFIFRRIMPFFELLQRVIDDIKETGLNAKVQTIHSKLASLLSDQELQAEMQIMLGAMLNKIEDTESPEQLSVFLKSALKWLDKIPLNPASVQCGPATPPSTSLDTLIGPLLRPPSIQPVNSLRLPGQIGKLFSNNADVIPQLFSSMQPRLRDTLYQAWSNAKVKTDPPELKSIHALGLKAPLFGNNAQVKMKLQRNTDQETDEIRFVSVPNGDWDPKDAGDEATARLYLDNGYESIMPGTYMVIRKNETFAGNSIAARAVSINIKPRTAYTLSGKTTQVELSREWWKAGGDDSQDDSNNEMSAIRKTIVYVETEQLSLAMEPENTPVTGNEVDLQNLYGGLTSGRWVIITGDLSDISSTTGVKAAELAMLSSVEQVFDKTLPGDNTHTRIGFAKTLGYSFKRDTVTIYGNVVRATNGETRKEVLGSGGSQALQAFNLKQPPLTFVSASNPSGVDSTLKVYVNDVRWHETDSLSGLSPTDRKFITRTDDQGNTTVVFGNGREGARLPTGIENIKAEYRNGIGKSGNVDAGGISMLTTRPLGVKDVTNPLRASGGADKESRDQARKNAPLAVKALDRLVSVQDYEDFARTFAGVGKSHAVELTNGRQRLVHVTIAGADDIPIDETSDLFQYLSQALHDSGDPFQPIQLAVRELKLIVISAGVSILPDYLWEPVVTQLRSALLEAFSFKRRELGQDAPLSELISVMQAVPGVAYVDVDAFGGIPEKKVEAGKRRLLTPEEISREVNNLVNKKRHPASRITVNLADFEERILRPAQLAFLTPDVPATLILNQIT